MRTPRTIRLLIGLVGISGLALLTGCIAVGDYGPSGDRGHFYPSGGKTRDVEGTVERVDPSNRRIVVTEGAEGEPDRREIALYYDGDTEVEHDGQHYRPEDLEPGDRIHTEAEVTAEGLTVQQIEVISDVQERGATEEEPLPQAPPAPEAPGARRHAPPLRGTVRFVDTHAHTLEIETPGESGRPGLVEVLYDRETIVEFEGRRYSPENLERGDQVEVDVRAHGGRMLADHIEVVREGETDDQ